MPRKNNRPEQAAELRRRAEDIARKKAARSPETIETLSPEETRQQLHELQFHQIELEMQNEELRKAQLQLDAERENYFNFYNLAPVGYFTLSEKGLILEANFTAVTMMGVARGMLIKQPLTHFILPDDQAIFYLSLKKLLDSGGPQLCDLRIVKKDKTAFWVNLSATTVPGADGTTVYRVVMSDITERKRAEEALGESEKKFRSLYISMSEGMALHQLIYDTAGKAVDYLLVSVNPAFEAIVGLKAEQVLGHKATDIYCTAEAPFLDVYAQVVTTGQPAKFESKFEPMGKFFRIIVFSPAKDQFATVFEDITSRKRAEEQIKESLAEKDILLKEVHHRVKNNLAAVIGLLDLEAHAQVDEPVRSVFFKAGHQDQIHGARPRATISLRELLPGQDSGLP